MPPPAPAVYREPGGVPIPPDLRPFSHAGSAPVKGLPRGRASARPCRRGSGVAGSSRCSGRGDRRRRWTAGQAARDEAVVPARCPTGSARRATDRSGGVGYPADFRPFGTGLTTHRAAIRNDARPLLNPCSPTPGTRGTGDGTRRTGPYVSNKKIQYTIPHAGAVSAQRVDGDRPYYSSSSTRARATAPVRLWASSLPSRLWRCRFNRAHVDRQRLGDRTVGVALRHQPQHLVLPVASSSRCPAALEVPSVHGGAVGCANGGRHARRRGGHRVLV